MNILHSILELLKYPEDYGINLFIIGVLFILSLYHLILYIQNRNKNYLYYHFFTGFMFLFLLIDHTDCCQGTNKEYLAFYLSIPLQWIYNTFYLLFIKEFTDFKLHRYRWNKFLNILIVGFFISIVALFLVSILLGHNTFLVFSYVYFFLPLITIAGLISIVMLFKFKSKIKYYVLAGSIVFLLLSWLAQYFELVGYKMSGIFYIAIIFENLFFALGLGFKQKQIGEEKIFLKNNLIIQLEENQNLKEKLNLKLKNEIIEKGTQLEKLVKESEERNKNQLRLEYEHKLLDLKMTAIMSQMNPHFLFNSLNSIKSFIIKNDKKEAIYYLNKFSSLIRATLNNSRNHFISLKEELEFIKLYVEIENIRLSKSLDFSIKLKNIQDVANIIIPPMLLQPFVENAIWHGLSTKIDDKKISILIYKEDEFICIEIEDNGIGREKANEILKTKMFHKESLGLKLTGERLLAFEKISGKKNHLEFIDKYDSLGKASGTKVILKI